MNCYKMSILVFHYLFQKEHYEKTLWHKHIEQSGTQEALTNYCTKNCHVAVGKGSQTKD